MKRIPVAAPVLDGNVKQYVLDCIDSTWISSSGKYLEKFEASFASFCNVKHAIAVNNGTTAIHLALVAMGIGEGDEVIVPTLTYIASANAVKYCNATPVFVDSEADTFNLDPLKLEEKITPRTKAIMVVHLYGHPVDMDAINEISAKHGIPVIEDAAEALGAEYKGRKTGQLGKCATFSFFGNKIVTTGEGGMVTTDDDELAARLRLFRGQGMDPQRRYWFPVIGFNYRMTNVAAAIGVSQMERIETALDRRKTLANWYDAALAPLDNFIIRPLTKERVRHSFWMYTILLRDSDAATRDRLMAFLDEKGIETRPVFYPMHVLPPYQEDASGFPVAERLAGTGVNLPTHELVTQEDVAHIAANLREFLDHQAV